MTVYIDIDNTICTQVNGGDYSKAKPIYRNIRKVNELFDRGDIIVYWTARGMNTHMDWREVTESQFQKWGIKYHRLVFDKPVYDLFICDKARNIENLGG